jgi:protein TonB
MTAHALLLSVHDRRDEVRRWTLAAAIVVAAHFGLVATYFLIPKAGPAGAPFAPAVIVDLAPAPVAPASQQDLTPGPETPEVVESKPEPVPQVEPEIEPLPKVEAPAEVVLPEPEKKPVEEKPVVKPPEPKKKIERRPTSRATAAPRSQDQTADKPAAPNPGSQASRAAIADWRSQVSARLQSVKRCPSGTSGTGSVVVSFAVDRSGSVAAKSVVRGSGNSAFDQEALAMVSRASPFPPVPAVQPTPVRLPVPINFTCR